MAQESALTEAKAAAMADQADLAAAKAAQEAQADPADRADQAFHQVGCMDGFHHPRHHLLAFRDSLSHRLKRSPA